MNLQTTISIVGVVITVMLFLGSVLLAVVGYFLKSFHTEYKSDKKDGLLKDQKIEERITALTNAFTDKLEKILDKIGERINKLPLGSDNLNTVMLQLEKDIGKRLDEHGQRLQNNHNRIETVAKRVHELVNIQTPFRLKQQIEDYKKKKQSLAETEGDI